MICPYCKQEMELDGCHCSKCRHTIYNLPVKKIKKKTEEK